MFTLNHTISPKDSIDTYTHLLVINHSMDNLYHLLELYQYFEILKYDIYLINNIPTIYFYAQYAIKICYININLTFRHISFLLDNLALLDLRVNNSHHTIPNYLIFFTSKLHIQGYNISKNQHNIASVQLMVKF